MNIDSATRLFVVLGDPVAHSLSPLMHNCAFQETGFNGVYVALRVTDPKAAMAAVRALGIAGCSVTIPHKEAVFPYLDKVTPFARKVGAVNTIINRGGYLVGDNTDGPGALRALQAKTSIADKKVALIGAGGAAKGIGHAICDAGGIVTVVNRTAAKGEQLAKALSATFVPLSEMEKIHFDLLINTTSVGMHPSIDESPLSGNIINQKQIIMDIIYNPLETKFLKSARQKGCTVIDGVEMFVRQGAMQFELWTGVKAPIEKMDAVVRRGLSNG